MLKKILCIIVFGSFCIPLVALGEMTSTNYRIMFDAVGVNGGDVGTSASYSLSDTLGEIPGIVTSTSYVLEGGFQAADYGTLSFSLDTNSLNLGTLSTSTVNTASAVATVSADSVGYNLVVNSVSGAMPAPVTGGAVVAGTEAYGFSASGPHSLVVGDVPVSAGLLVVSSTAPVAGEQTTFTFKAAASPSSVGGSYSQAIDLVASANF